MRRYTTILLTTRRLNSRDRAVLAIVVICLTLFAAGLAVGNRPADRSQLAPRISQAPFYIIITSTPPATAPPQPTPAPLVIFATVEVPIVVEHYVEVQAAPRAESAPEAAPPAGPAPMRPGETLADYAARSAAEQHTAALPPSDPTATPLPPLVVGETLAEYFQRTGITPETVR